MDDLDTEAIRTIKTARLGDQNALDMVRLVGINATKGDARAIASKKAMSDWILAHPVADVRPNFTMGHEAASTCGVLMTCAAWQVPSVIADLGKAGNEQELGVATLILSRRATLSPELIEEMAQGLPEGPRRLFWWGIAACTDQGPANDYLNKQPAPIQGIARAGKAVGTARRIQQVIRGAPISILDRQAGLEHGEP